MRTIFILLFSLFLLESCKEQISPSFESENSDTISSITSEEEPSYIKLNSETSDDSVKYQIELEKLNKSEFNFTIKMELFGESWIVSPLEKEYPYGPMKIEFDNNGFIETVNEIKESPESRLLNDYSWDVPYRVISGTTTLNQKIKILTKGDFITRGNIFFVLEPVCTVYRLNFEIICNSGQLSIEETISPLLN